MTPYTHTYISSPGKELQWGKPPLQVLPEALGEAAPCWGPSTLVGATYQVPWGLRPFSG